MADPPDKSPSGEFSMTSMNSDGNSSGVKSEQNHMYEKRNGTGIIKPVTPTARDRWGRLKSTVAATTHISSKKKNGLDRGDSFLRKFSTRNQVEETIILEGDDDNKVNIDRSYRKHRTCGSYVMHPSGGLMFYWLGAVTLTVLYNLWTCIAREAFREIQKGYMVVWFSLDAFADLIYVCDTLVQFRTGYLQQGLMVYDTKKLCINYMKSKSFIIDLLCLLPLDFVQFYTGIHPMIRFPRFLKIYRSFRFMHMYESRTAYPNLLRVLSLSHILFLGSHWFAAFYYLISEAEGFEGRWSYPEPEGIHASVTRKYLASLYWSTLTLTTIGDLPPPDTNWQYVFVIVSYLIGVFIFATIVGQVGNVITNRNASRQEFERLLDGAKFYMQMHNVPTELQKRVQRWYDYVWTRGRLNCNDINSLGLLPDKLKTELALHVNLGTLRKVTIFQKCRPEFLHDLMLKMRAYIFTPGDLICRRGEVAREMFIIADGVVEIIGENSTVLTQMSTGDFFGEIGILNLDGGINRRTADVRSVGYAELFVLSREDVLAALKDHPDAEQIIREYGQRRLRETEEHRKMVRSAPSSPDPSSAWKGSKEKNKNTPNTEHSNLLHLPQVKYLQNLSQMSPKLRKVFNIRPKRSNSKLQDKSIKEEKYATDPERAGSLKRDLSAADRRRSFQADHNKTFPIASLDVIQEKDQSDVSDYEQGDRDAKEPGNFNLAKAVLNLIRSQKQAEYTAINAEDADNTQTNSANKDDTSSKETQEPIAPESSHSGSVNVMSRRRYHSYHNQREERTDGHNNANRCIRKHHSVDLQDNSSKRLPLPKIVLTDSNRQISSTSSSDDDSDKEDGRNNPTTHTIPIRPSSRDSESRRSSPSILALPSSLRDRLNRRISLPPPLDLPIEVPKFSNFHGLTRNSSDVSHSLNRFKDTMERRMDHLESSYKETMAKLDETTKMQERFMKTIIKKLTSVKAKDRQEDNVFTERNENTASVNKHVDRHKYKAGTSSSGSSEEKVRASTIQRWGAKTSDNTTHQTQRLSCGRYSSSSSSTDSQGAVTYAINPSVDNIQHFSYDELSRPSSIDSLPNTSQGAHAPQSFQVHDGNRHVIDTNDDLDSSGNFEFPVDDRVTHL